MKYKEDFYEIIKDIVNTDDMQKLKLYKHHYGSNRFEHSMSVAYYSYLICRFLHIDYKSAARAGMVHDLFLYDCENKLTRPKNHLEGYIVAFVDTFCAFKELGNYFINCLFIYFCTHKKLDFII